MQPDSTAQLAWFATCPKGVEALLATELAVLGAANVRETVAGVHFEGTRATAYRACLWSRLANRILWPLAQVPAAGADQLYRGLVDVDWGSLFGVDKSLAVDFAGSNEAIRNSQFGAQRCKDAIVDWFRSHGGQRPNIDRKNAQVRVAVRLVRDRAQVSLDFSGGSLHQRGYRLGTGAAPLKENLAAAILLRADWPAIAARGGALIDPMCGSATLLLEGAMMAADMAPALSRRHFGFDHLRCHDRQQWQALVAEARGRADRGMASQLPEIRGYDADPRVIRRAQENIARCGLQKVVRVSVKPLAEVTKPTHRPLSCGLLLTNPPYGERLGEREELNALYRCLGEVMANRFSGWSAGVFTSDLELGKATGLRSHKRYALYNGAIPTHLLLFDLADNRLRDPPPEPASAAAAAPQQPAGAGEQQPLSEGAQMFANRLRKNRRRLSGWVRRENVECYRLYDADMPEYAVAVDVYGDRVHVAEYKAPRGVSVEAAERRLGEIRAALPQALGVGASHIVYKQRAQQKGSAQYERRDTLQQRMAVHEGAATLLVNLTDYLDTGLFLDHRPLRLRIGAEASGTDFLNLFCYTGTATVHAALGGARSTTSVDTSNTYLDWLRENLARNGLDDARHRRVRADCRQWLAGTTERFDLVLLDPPSFSNSRDRDDTFDVQRDHPDLLRQAMAVLRPQGRLYFSTNRRGFRLDEELERAFRCEEITAATLGPDFQRSKAHRCWLFRHGAAAPDGRGGAAGANGQEGSA